MASPNTRVREAFEKFVLKLEEERDVEAHYDASDDSEMTPTSPVSSDCPSPRHVPVSFRKGSSGDLRAKSRNRSPVQCIRAAGVGVDLAETRGYDAMNMQTSVETFMDKNERDGFKQLVLKELVQEIKVDVMKAISESLKNASQPKHVVCKDPTDAVNRPEGLNDLARPAHLRRDPCDIVSPQPRVFPCFLNAANRYPNALSGTRLAGEPGHNVEGDMSDLHVLKSAEQILEAMDVCNSKLGGLGGSAKANVTLTFCPEPPISTAHALNMRVAAMSVNLCDKTNEASCRFPRGVTGGQRGQPSVAVFWSSTHKLTVQVHAKKANVVLKGRRSAFSHSALRKFVPFLGVPVLASTNAGSDV